MRLAVVAVMVAGLFVLVPSTARAEVLNCGGDQPLSTLTCAVSGPAMIDDTSFAGDGGSSAQYQ